MNDVSVREKERNVILEEEMNIQYLVEGLDGVKIWYIKQAYEKNEG